MSWITPLGFLGLISIIVLILIYILKPNYQKKVISTTFVWKLSLKYRKKRFPINRFRNLLIFICQVLALTAGALILAGPIVKAEDTSATTEKILVIESSANMLAEVNEQTRFERAVDFAIKEVENIAAENGLVSVIIADSTPVFMAQRIDASGAENLCAELKALIGDELQCSYGSADVEGAISLAEIVLQENQKSEIVLYTATEYLSHEGITIEPVSVDGEWNVAILDCRARLVDNYYVFEIDVACYGSDKKVRVYCDAYGANEKGEKISFEQQVTFKNDEVQTIEIQTVNEEDKKIYEYEYVSVYVREADSFAQDNTFYVYGGKREQLKVQYASTAPNIFVAGSLMMLRSTMGDQWDISIKEVNLKKDKPLLEGFDLYVFEHQMPDVMPTDGIVFLINPSTAPNGLNMLFGGEANGPIQLTHGVSSPITQFLNPESIVLNKYQRVFGFDGFDPLLYCGSDPVFLVRNEESVKVAVMAFSVHYTQAPLLKEFPALFYGLYKYFLPETLTGYSYQVEDKVSLNSRSGQLKISGPGVKETLKEFPTSLTVIKPGIYTLTQKKLNGTEVVENFFVRTPAEESNIVKVKDILTVPYVEKRPDQLDVDLLIYFAAALVALLFIEWLLQSSDV